MGLALPTGPNFLGIHPSGSGCSLYFPLSSCTTGKHSTEWKPPATLMISAKQTGLKPSQMWSLSLQFCLLKGIKLVIHSWLKKYMLVVTSCGVWSSSQLTDWVYEIGHGQFGDINKKIKYSGILLLLHYGVELSTMSSLRHIFSALTICCNMWLYVLATLLIIPSNLQHFPTHPFPQLLLSETLWNCLKSGLRNLQEQDHTGRSKTFTHDSLFKYSLNTQ